MSGRPVLAAAGVAGVAAPAPRARRHPHAAPLRAARRNELEWESERPAAPLAPPPPSRPPPPPPPPPPGPSESLMDAGGRRRMFLGGLVGAAAIGLSRVVFERGFAFPGMSGGNLRVDPRTGLEYLVTKGGNRVAVSTDADGHLWMVDKAGDLYFDTGDVNVGVFVVSRDGEMTNLWEEHGKMQRKYVGNLNNMTAVDTKEAGQVVGFPNLDVQKYPLILPETFSKDIGAPQGTFPRVLEDRSVDPIWLEKLAKKFGEIK